MFRKINIKLKEWTLRSRRHPLILRGARQVGKTYLVRELARAEFEHYLELNFEKEPSLSTLFRSRDPKLIGDLLVARFSIPLVDGRTLLFLDELQDAEPVVLESLRYFYEERPALHIIAAGSLLEFMLDAGERTRRGLEEFPMPVGRIEYMYVAPMDFEEFLTACGRQGLVDWLAHYALGDEVPDALDEELHRLLRQYLVIGGMPAAVAAYADGDTSSAAREQQTIISTYQDDFAKYARRARPELLQKVFQALPSVLGRKMIYTHLDGDSKSRDLSAAFNLLRLARVVAKVCHTPANGIPIGFGVDESTFKPLFLDVGLSCRMLGLHLTDFLLDGDTLLENRGAICEQFVGQHLLYSGLEYEEPKAYCWMRENANASAEVDYVVQYGTDLVPVEVKHGRSGSMKGLHFFLNDKARHFAVRLNADKPSFVPDCRVKDSLGRECVFALLSLPLYLICQLERLARPLVHERNRVVKPA